MKKVFVVLLCMLSVLAFGIAGCKESCDHVPERVDAVEATCTAQGNIEYWYCYKCGKYFADEECTKPIANRNDVIIAEKGHTMVHHDAKEPTCTEPGWYAYDECSVCGKSDKNFIPPKGHDLELVSDTATCTEDGVAHFKCKVCGYEVDKVSKAKGHKVDNYVYNNDATCDTDGTETGTCSVCGKEITRIAADTATGHIPLDDGVVHNPTCTEKGYTEHTCATCGKKFVTDYVEALGHDMSIEINEERTCEHGTITGHKCARCGYIETTEANDKLAHDFDENGVCKICHKNYKEANIYDISIPEYKGELVNGTWKMTANEFVLTDTKTFTITIPTEVVNAFIKDGYEMLTFKFGRKEKNMATRFEYGKGDMLIMSNLAIAVEKKLVEGKPLIIEDLKITNIPDWVGLSTNPNNPDAPLWIPADGFAMDVNYTLKFDENNPASWIKTDEKFDYVDGVGYVFGTNEYITANIEIRKELLDILTSGNQYEKIRITAKTNGSFGGAIGHKKKGEPDSAYKYMSVKFSLDYLKDEITEEGIAIGILYGTGVGKPEGFTLTVELVKPLDYTQTENWFTAEKPCTKVSENSFDFELPPMKSSDPYQMVMSFDSAATTYLSQQGYTKLKFVYGNKSNENGKLVLSVRGIYESVHHYNTDTIELSFKKGDTVAIMAHYIVNEGTSTGINITVSAIK